MTLTELKYIVAVARERHFGRAAEACFVAQPTLSVAVKKLEEELDVKLFERSASEVTLTPLGEEVVRQAALIGVDVPIAAAVQAVMAARLSARDAVLALLAREPKREH